MKNTISPNVGIHCEQKKAHLNFMKSGNMAPPKSLNASFSPLLERFYFCSLNILINKNNNKTEKLEQKKPAPILAP